MDKHLWCSHATASLFVVTLYAFATMNFLAGFLGIAATAFAWEDGQRRGNATAVVQAGTAQGESK